MKENLQQALDFVILDEVGAEGLKDGAPHTDPDDPGGFTIWGLSKRAHPWISEKTTRKEAEDTYEKVYWRAVGADVLPSGLDYLAFDFAVNAGVLKAKSILSLANTEEDKIEGFSQYRAWWYYDLVDAKPALKKFLNGWIARTWNNNRRAHIMAKGDTSVKTST